MHVPGCKTPVFSGAIATVTFLTTHTLVYSFNSLRGGIGLLIQALLLTLPLGPNISNPTPNRVVSGPQYRAPYQPEYQ